MKFKAKLLNDTNIPLTREHTYEQLYFEKGLPVLQGTYFPLTPNAFKMKKNLSAPPPWKDVLSAYGLDSRNLSYPKD